MNIKTLRLLKNADRRLRNGHLWIYSNEIDAKFTPLKSFCAGEEVLVENIQGNFLGRGYINPHSLIAIRLFSQHKEQGLDKNFILSRIHAALALRELIFKKPFYRLVFSEGDGLPGLIIDRYDAVLVLQINTAGMDVKTPLLVECLRILLPRLKAIVLRNDTPSRTQEGLPRFTEKAFGDAPVQVLMEENTVKFNAPILEGQKTGWFYDHRFNRARLKDYVQGKSVLDVFSYVGAWGITAAFFGAKEVTCVESSAKAARYIQENAELNLLQDKLKILEEDAFLALKQLKSSNTNFDVIILDPPAFVKKLKDKTEGLLAYQRLNESALRLLNSEGILIACSCSMHISYEELLETLRRAAYRTNTQIQLLERGHQSPDHPQHIAIPETQYLKMIMVRKVSFEK